MPNIGDVLALLVERRARSRLDLEGALESVALPSELQVAALPRTAIGTRIIIRPGEDGGVIAQSKYLIAELASKEKFIVAEIRTNRIQQIERLLSKANSGATLEFDFWRQGDGKQELASSYRTHCERSDGTVGPSKGESSG